MKTTRLLKYYALKLKRSKGSPHSIAGGIAVGTFVGLTPTMPFHTALIVILCIITRTSIVIAVAVSWLVCNPLTYLPIYYFSARLGNTFTPYSLQMSKVREIMEQFQLNANFMDILSMILEAGFEALIVMLAGGVLIGLPAGIVTYYLFLLVITRMRMSRADRHILK